MERHAGEIAIASPTWHELRFGLERLQPSRRRVQLEEFLRAIQPTVDIVPYDDLAAEWHARERARLERGGYVSAVIDAQVAAIAAVRDLTLVTDNLKHFDRFEGLSIENWLSARLH